MSIHPAQQRRRRSAGFGRGLLALALALVGHAALVGLVLFLSLVEFNLPKEKARAAPPRSVALRSISSNQWAQNRSTKAGPASDQAAPTPAPAEAKKEAKREETKPKGQVVDVAPGNGEQSEDAKYLAERDNKVQKETRAKEQTAFYRNATPQRSSNAPKEGAGSDEVDKPQLAGNHGIGEDDRPLREAGPKKGVFEIPDSKERQEVALKPDQTGRGPGAEIANRTESEEIAGNSNRLKIQPGVPGAGDENASAGKRGALGAANLVPSMAVLDKISGAAPNDHLGEVDEGQGTFLNTKEWKYSSFFNRVKQSVGMHWSPAEQLRQRDPTGGIYGGRDRYTVVNVTLTDQGMVKEIYVEKSSGLDFLDLEAIHSFERAQPFPNPPPGLLASDATVHFSFGFFLEMGGGPRMRLFRQAN